MLMLSKNPKDVVFWNAGSKAPTPSKPAPNVLFRTLGPYKLAHTLRSNNYTAQVIDFATLMTEDELYNYTVKFIDNSTACLAISTTYILDSISNFEFDSVLINVINRVVSEYPNLHLVFGGYGIGMLKSHLHTINKKQVTFVSQYGEDLMLELVQYFKGDGQRPKFSLEFDSTGDTVIHLYSTALQPKFDIQTDRFRFSKEDAIQPNETLPLEISRGCIFKCKFCNHLLLGRGKLDYLRDFELVKEELIYNYENWGVTNYYIVCDTFNDTEIKMKAWHDMVMSLPFKINFTTYLRADLLDRFPDVPYMLKESGLLSTYHGIETLGVEGSVVIGKGWSGKSAREYIPRLYHDIWGKEVHQTISLIAGLPGDTREILLDTAHWFRDNNLYHVAWHTLGLATNLTSKNASEFERNSEKYGYTLNRNMSDIDDWRWQTSYWNNIEVNQYLQDTLLPIVEPNNSKFGSWGLLQMLQYNIDKLFLRKENQRMLGRFIKQMSVKWFDGYKSSLATL